MKTLAPILLFTYKRLHTLQLTVKALQENTLSNQSNLYIFSDGPKSESDEVVIHEIRQYLKTITGFKSITITESPLNKGLANSIINGVTEVIKKHGKVIVLEDDLKTTPNFLAFMNTALDFYANIPRVYSISGYSFDLGESNTYSFDGYFLNRGWSWGWATWSDRWETVDWSMADYSLFSCSSKDKRKFAQGGSDLNGMLKKQMTGELDSWAIRWFYHQFKANGLTLYPKLSKVDNNGFDENATHTTGSIKRYLPSIDQTLKYEFTLPNSIELTSYYQKKFQYKMGIVSRIVSKIDSFINKR